MAPAEFNEGDAVVGWILLGAGVAGLFGAGLFGWSSDRIRRRATDAASQVADDEPDDGHGVVADSRVSVARA
jgi:hypothetical protein